MSVPVLVTTRDVMCLRVLAKMEICKDMREALDALYGKLDAASVVESDVVPRSVITMGSRVLYFDRKADVRRDVTLVYPWNDAPYAGRLSVLSPLGTALLGAGIGASVRYSPAPSITARVDVLDVLYQPEAAGHL